MLKTNAFAFITTTFNLVNSKDDTLKNSIQHNLRAKMCHIYLEISKIPSESLKKTINTSRK